MFLKPYKFDIGILNVLTFYSASLSLLSDFHADVGKWRSFVTVARVQTVDDNILEFKIFPSRYRNPLKFNSLSGESKDTSWRGMFSIDFLLQDISISFSLFYFVPGVCSIVFSLLWMSYTWRGPWCILFADNIVLIDKTSESVNQKLELWRSTFKE